MPPRNRMFAGFGSTSARHEFFADAKAVTLSRNAKLDGGKFLRCRYLCASNSVFYIPMNSSLSATELRRRTTVYGAGDRSTNAALNVARY